MLSHIKVAFDVDEAEHMRMVNRIAALPMTGNGVLEKLQKIMSPKAEGTLQ